MQTNSEALGARQRLQRCNCAPPQPRTDAVYLILSHLISSTWAAAATAPAQSPAQLLAHVTRPGVATHTCNSLFNSQRPSLFGAQWCSMVLNGAQCLTRGPDANTKSGEMAGPGRPAALIAAVQ